MNLTTYYEKHGRAGLREIAEKLNAIGVKRSVEYLWLCAAIHEKTGKPRKQASTTLCRALVELDMGFTLDAQIPPLH